MWNDRLVGCPTNLNVWQKILSVRSLMFKKENYIDVWIEFCKLALKEHKNDVCKMTLDLLRNEVTNVSNTKIPELELIDLELKYRF